MSDAESLTSPALEALQAHVDALTPLALDRIHTLRKLPSLLLSPSSSTSAQIRAGFSDIAALADLIRSDKVQDALKAAKESGANEEGLVLIGRREGRKRRREPSVEPPPRPVPSPPTRSPYTFPPNPAEAEPLTLSSLPEYVKARNSTPNVNIKLRIWLPSRASVLRSPVYVHANVKDVLQAYIRLEEEDPPQVGEDVEMDTGAQRRLRVESVSVFGHREKKPPHAHSDYTVCQKVSQHIARMIQHERPASLVVMVDLLSSYENLFTSNCSVCERMVNGESSLPPVGRVWVDAAKEGESGRWDPKHASCIKV